MLAAGGPQGGLSGAMDTQTIVQQGQEMRVRIRKYAERARDASDTSYGGAAKAQVCEFLRNYAGRKSAFLAQAEAMNGEPRMRS